MKFMTALVLAVTLLVAGCSSAEETGARDSAGGDAQPRLFNESEIVEHLGLVDDGTGTESYVYRGPGQVVCDVYVVLASSQAVELYANAGDNVASNSIGSAGVKFGGAELADCQEALTAAMADLD